VPTGDHGQFDQIIKDHPTPITGKLPTMSVVFTDMNFKKRVRERTLSFRRIILTTHWKYDFDAYS